jgi:tetratricopeptide (TPR) repeat protein
MSAKTKGFTKSASGAPKCRRTSNFSVTALLLGFAFLSAACPPTVVRVPVPAEDIIQANEAVRQADFAFARKEHYAALIKYLEASRLNPNSEFIMNKLGIAYSQVEHYPGSIAAFERSIALNPKYAYSYNNLGSVYFAMNNLKKAEKHFRKAIELGGKVASFHINLGTLYFERNKSDKAMAEWRKALAIDPAVLNRSEGVSLAASRNKSSPMEKAYFMARLYASSGDVEHAIQSLEQALSAGFTDIEAIHSERDFDPIRKDEKFVAFMKTASLLSPKPKSSEDQRP